MNKNSPSHFGNGHPEPPPVNLSPGLTKLNVKGMMRDCLAPDPWVTQALRQAQVDPQREDSDMATEVRTEAKALAKNFGQNIETDLALEFLRVVENAAIASAHTMGQGERKLADEAATQAMRKTMDTVPMRGTIVIGEGERDEAPMLFIGEQVGASFPDGTKVPEIDIAVDPLEGTNLCATGAPGSITVLAASEKGGLLNAPDCYMEKIVVGPSCKGCVDLDAPVDHNLKQIAKALNRDVEDLVIIVLERPRHEKLIDEIRKAGARIRLIGDGDLSAGIAAAARSIKLAATAAGIILATISF